MHSFHEVISKVSREPILNEYYKIKQGTVTLNEGHNRTLFPAIFQIWFWDTNNALTKWSKN